ncbi:MAG: class I SAM-dependent methyltransferase, partial [Bdellovibrionales bacterium]|nr:class I SAM-dependent methyltransferase [Bdellovibrionales bacterium]
MKEKSINLPKSLTTDLKHTLYQASVQDPTEHLDLFEHIYRTEFKSDARILREDFCGTFLISTEWVRRSSENSAICIDISAEPLEYGKTHNLGSLSESQRSRLTILKQNVLQGIKAKSDIVSVCNFSFYAFKQRKQLLEYFQRAYQGLKKNGVFV